MKKNPLFKDRNTNLCNHEIIIGQPLKGKKIALCPIRTKQLVHIENFLRELGLIVIMATPKEHDEQIAMSLALIHLLGRALLRMGVENVEMATLTHERFMELVDIVRNGPEQLSVDMQTHNRFARKVRKTLIKELTRIDGELDAKA